MTELRKGDYALATKWSDGDPKDHWAIGFYDGVIEVCGESRYLVVDINGKQFRPGGFRRTKGIKPEVGDWLLAHKDQIEMSTRSLWGWEKHARKELRGNTTTTQEDN